MRKICVITGSRSEYGLLRWVMQGLKDDPDLRLQIIATGMHLSPEFGNTYKEIEQDEFEISCKVEMLMSSDTPIGITKSMGLGLIGFADAFHKLKPDIIVVLGDRFEIFSAVSAALIAKIPVAHLHGGEVTSGAYDDSLRHSITKMSHLHFVATKSYRDRVIQLGEHPDRVFIVGGLGIDSINRLNLLNREDLEKSLNFKLGQRSLLVTFHPETLSIVPPEKQIRELLAALDGLNDTQLIFTLPNADSSGRTLIKEVREFVSNHSNARAYDSLGQLKYLSCMSHVDGVIGNSSSGLIEAPVFKKGSINIGDRQCGRIQATSVINCAPTFSAIMNALSYLYSESFQSKLLHVSNPYGEGGASEKVVNILKTCSIDGVIRKNFFDLRIGATGA